MGIISRPNSYSANTTISSSEVNDDFDTLYDEFNGSVEAANLATAAVTTAKIADSNVTTVKIADSNVTTAKVADSNVTAPKVADGFVVQVASVGYNAFASGTTLIPLDDTIPQNTEGDEYMTLAITPKSATNILIIEAVVFCSTGTAARELICALFQDSTAGALAAASVFQATDEGRSIVIVRHRMVAGTTSATTFKIRAGLNTAGTFQLNGESGARRFGDIPKSSLTITEYKAS